MEYKDLFKAIRVRSLGESLAKRCQSMKAERQEKQREFFWGGVVAHEDSPCSKVKEIEKKKNSRIEMLKKWKMEKMKKMEEAKKKQKPAFKVGVVQRKVTGSPVFTQRKTCAKNNLDNKQCHVKSQISDSKGKRAGVITRARARNMAANSIQSDKVSSTVAPKLILNNKFCKIDKSKREQVNSHVFKVPEVVCKLPYSHLTLACSPKFTKKSKKLGVTEVKVANGSREVKQTPKSVQLGRLALTEVKVANESREVKQTPKPVQLERLALTEIKVANESREVKQTPKPVQLETPTLTEVKADKGAVQLKEQSKEDVLKDTFGIEKENLIVITPENSQDELDDFKPIHYSPFVTVRSGKKSERKSKKKLAIDVEEQIKKEEREFQCRIFSFRKYIDCETKRLMETCDKWKHIYEEFPELPEDVEGDIDSAIGKTTLLTSDKFNQFKGLIDKCENGDPFVKVDDLQGFQDWVSIEVERIDEEFHKLQNRKCNNWKLEIAPARVVAKKQPVKTVKNTTKKPVGKSSIRSHILAARKLLKEGNANGGEGSQLPVANSFEEEVVRAKTPRKEQSLLREVLNPERRSKKESSGEKFPAVRERRNSGLEIMLATQKNKFPTPVKLQKSPVVTDYEVLFRDDKTPNRSILKKTPKVQSSSKARVTFKRLSEGENALAGGRGLSEKYFQPVMDSDEGSPMRIILGDLSNLSVGGIMTRSRSRQMSSSAPMSPLVSPLVK